MVPFTSFAKNTMAVNVISVQGNIGVKKPTPGGKKNIIVRRTGPEIFEQDANYNPMNSYHANPIVAKQVLNYA